MKMHFFLDAGSKECGKRFDVIFGRRSPSLGEPASSSCSWLNENRANGRQNFVIFMIHFFRRLMKSGGGNGEPAGALLRLAVSCVFGH